MSTRAASRTQTPRQAPVHVTRRGRAALILAVALLLFGAFSLGRAASQASTTSATGPALQQLTVQPGDTLWEVARELSPEAGPRVVVEVLQSVNGLSGAHLRVGQQLVLPAAA